MVWELAQQMIGMVQSFFSPQTVVALTQRSNAVDQIATQYNLQERGQEFQVAMEAARQRHSQEMESYRQYCEDVRLQRRLDSEREQLARRFQHEEKIEQYRRETQLIVSQCQLFASLTIADNRDVRENFPLRTPASVLLDFYKNYRNSERPIPLLVIISPPGLEFDKNSNVANGFGRIENGLVDEVRDFCQKYYPLNSEKHPIKFQGADWETNRAYGETAINTLHHVLKSVPTVVLESKVDGDLIRMYIAAWDMMADHPYYEKALTIPWKEVLYPIAKKYAREWANFRMTLLEKGKSLEEIQRRGGDDEKNLLILEEEEEDRQFGRTGVDYKYLVNDQKYIQELANFLGVCHCILLGLMADRYHFSLTLVPPKLPEMLGSLLEKIPTDSLRESLVRDVVNGYEGLYQSLEKDRPHLLPDLYLDLAVSLSCLQDKSFARSAIASSLRAWLKLRNWQVYENNSLQQLFDAIASALTVADKEYVKKLNICLYAIGAKDLPDVMGIYNRIVTASEQVKYEAEQARQRREQAELSSKGKEFTFEVIKVDRYGKEIERKPGKGYQKDVDLGQGVILEMVYIPAGEFMMGAKKGEEVASDDEYPQHKVTIAKEFYMSKYPITQAQYKAIMGENPSYFKGNKRPVEQVTWNKAKELCEKLSKQTGKKYGLPSEAQWEYGARAGTTTAFHFGETLTDKLANYDARNTYANGPTGQYCSETTEVGSFLPNAFGLYDIHGNVWEWCEDDWHDNYKDAPNDGSAWILSNGDRKILRGGSWNYNPDYCRVANRDFSLRANILNEIGFRVSCEVV